MQVCHEKHNDDCINSCLPCYHTGPLVSLARFLSLARSKLRLFSANHRAGYFSNSACDWLSIVLAYSELETETGPDLAFLNFN